MLRPLICLKRRFIDARVAGDVLARSAEKRIVVGSGGSFAPGWVPTEIEFPDLCPAADWRGPTPPVLDAVKPAG